VIVYSTIILRVAIWSTRERSCLNPACSSLKVSSTSVFIVCNMTLHRILLGIDKSVIVWKILKHYGIPQKIISIIQQLYDGFSCQVIHDGKLTEPFTVTTGVRQGCILSSLPFDCLLYNYSESDNLVYKGTFLSESCLLVSSGFVYFRFYSL
jgi:hypothetical protein